MDHLTALPYPARSPIFDALNPADLMTAKKLSWALRCQVSQYERTTFGLNAIYGPFFKSFDDIERFRTFQSDSGALVSGSVLVRVLSRRGFTPSDLDLFVRTGRVLDSGKLLGSLGYKFKPLSTVMEGKRVKSLEQSPVFPEAVDAALASHHPGAGTVAERYDDCSVAGVFNFRNEDGMNVQVVATKGEPVEAILGFYSTLVMNVATATQVVSLYPMTSFVKRWAMYLRPYTWSVIHARIKYEFRGWQSVDMVTAAQAASVDNELSVKTRWFGDRHCWIIDLPPLANPVSKRDAFHSLKVTSWSLRYSAVSGARILVNRMTLPSLSSSYVITWEAERAVWHHPCFRSLDPSRVAEVIRIAPPSDPGDEDASSVSGVARLEGDGPGEVPDIAVGDEVVETDVAQDDDSVRTRFFA
ncbi:hypothetical protein VNI00_018284 [Paramarasmius palmivorus]|uniref:F-box domain-containing protein n=1 Tax=Paramarasmius palmivorus TaxID=297713 RepID=A0AAW0AYV2_9AGAR